MAMHGCYGSLNPGAEQCNSIGMCVLLFCFAIISQIVFNGSSVIDHISRCRLFSTTRPLEFVSVPSPDNGNAFSLVRRMFQIIALSPILGRANIRANIRASIRRFSFLSWQLHEAVSPCFSRLGFLILIDLMDIFFPEIS